MLNNNVKDLPSSSFAIIVECNTHRSPVVPIVLANDLLTVHYQYIFLKNGCLVRLAIYLLSSHNLA